MEDLLEKDCIVIANEWGLFSLCSKYRIPCTKLIHTSLYSRDSTKYAFVISKHGVREYDKNAPAPAQCTVFRTLEALRFYLFKRALFNSKIVVQQKDYHIYLKTIKHLKKIGIRTIKDKTYYEDADCFYVSGGAFKELSYFGGKRIVTMAGGVQFRAGEFLNELKSFLKNKNNYKKYITYYQSKIGEEL